MEERTDATALVRFDWTEYDSPSAAVVDAVGVVSRADLTELPPLYDSVDPDALEAFFAPAAVDGTDRSLAFTFNGFRVVVEGTGEGRVFR